MADRVARAKTLAESDRFYRLERFFQRIAAEEIMARPIPIYETHRDRLEELADLPANGAGGTLELDDSLAMPPYYEGVDFHLMPGSWDGYDLYGKSGPIALPFAFKYGGFAAVPLNSNLFAQRLDVIRQLPKPRYDRIYEPGCGGFGTMRALHEVFPDAETGRLRYSPRQARGTFEAAEKNGIAVHVRQRDAAVDTGEPDESFDAVLSYAVQHELPYAANIAMFREMFRIMKPGADIVIADPPPFRAVDPFHAAILTGHGPSRGALFFRGLPRELGQRAPRDRFRRRRILRHGAGQLPLGDARPQAGGLSGARLFRSRAGHLRPGQDGVDASVLRRQRRADDARHHPVPENLQLGRHGGRGDEIVDRAGWDDRVLFQQLFHDRHAIPHDPQLGQQGGHHPAQIVDIVLVEIDISHGRGPFFRQRGAR